MTWSPSPERLDRWHSQWLAYLDEKRSSKGVTAHWNWPLKRLEFAFRGGAMLVGAECAGLCQGMLLLSWPKASRLADGLETAYVELLEVAPWNREEVAGDREFSGIGQNLLFAAYDMSKVVGYEGRLSLASLPTSETFYRRIGMVQRGHGDGEDCGLKFFEFQEAAATAFRNG